MEHEDNYDSVPEHMQPQWGFSSNDLTRNWYFYRSTYISKYLQGKTQTDVKGNDDHSTLVSEPVSELLGKCLEDDEDLPVHKSSKRTIVHPLMDDDTQDESSRHDTAAARKHLTPMQLLNCMSFFTVDPEEVRRLVVTAAKLPLRNNCTTSSPAADMANNSATTIATGQDGPTALNRNLVRDQVLQTYTANIPIVSLILSDESQLGNEERTKMRLDRLTTDSTIKANQLDLIHHIEGLDTDLKQCWGNGERVKSLRVTIQAIKLLGNTKSPQVYPSLFVLVSTVLDTFGDFVADRLMNTAAGTSFVIASLLKRGQDAASDLIPEEAVEMCNNWFLKIASIRELLPRIYVELSLLKCTKFVAKKMRTNMADTVRRLASQIRGVADPLVAAHCRWYLFMRAQDVLGGSKRKGSGGFAAIVSTKGWAAILEECALDTFETLAQCMKLPAFTRMLVETNIDSLGEYLYLFVPALEWMLTSLVMYGGPVTATTGSSSSGNSSSSGGGKNVPSLGPSTTTLTAVASGGGGGDAEYRLRLFRKVLRFIEPPQSSSLSTSSHHPSGGGESDDDPSGKGKKRVQFEDPVPHTEGGGATATTSGGGSGGAAHLADLLFPDASMSLCSTALLLPILNSFAAEEFLSYSIPSILELIDTAQIAPAVPRLKLIEALALKFAQFKDLPLSRAKKTAFLNELWSRVEADIATHEQEETDEGPVESSTSSSSGLLLTAVVDRMTKKKGAKAYDYLTVLLAATGALSQFAAVHMGSKQVNLILQFIRKISEQSGRKDSAMLTASLKGSMTSMKDSAIPAGTLSVSESIYRILSGLLMIYDPSALLTSAHLLPLIRAVDVEKRSILVRCFLMLLPRDPQFSGTALKLSQTLCDCKVLLALQRRDLIADAVGNLSAKDPTTAPLAEVQKKNEGGPRETSGDREDEMFLPNGLIDDVISTALRRVASEDPETHLEFLCDVRHGLPGLDSVKMTVIHEALRMVHRFGGTKKRNAAKAYLAFCHVTIPAVYNLYLRMKLAIVAAGVAFQYGFVAQGEALLHLCISYLKDLTPLETTTIKSSSSSSSSSTTASTTSVAPQPSSRDAFTTVLQSNDVPILEVVLLLLGISTSIPSHAKYGHLYIVSSVLNWNDDFPWPNTSVGKVAVYSAVIRVVDRALTLPSANQALLAAAASQTNAPSLSHGGGGGFWSGHFDRCGTALYHKDADFILLCKSLATRAARSMLELFKLFGGASSSSGSSIKGMEASLPPPSRFGYMAMEAFETSVIYGSPSWNALFESWQSGEDHEFKHAKSTSLEAAEKEKKKSTRDQQEGEDEGEDGGGDSKGSRQKTIAKEEALVESLTHTFPLQRQVATESWDCVLIADNTLSSSASTSNTGSTTTATPAGAPIIWNPLGERTVSNGGTLVGAGAEWARWMRNVTRNVEKLATYSTWRQRHPVILVSNSSNLDGSDEKPSSSSLGSDADPVKAKHVAQQEAKQFVQDLKGVLAMRTGLKAEMEKVDAYVGKKKRKQQQRAAAAAAAEEGEGETGPVAEDSTGGETKPVEI